MLRCEQLEAIEKERPKFFGELDTRYYALTSTEPPKEDAGQLMLSFIRRHPDAPIRKMNTA